MAYDRSEFVRLLTDYYNFCNRVFWNATVAQAPSGGWTSINQETLAPLKRNDTVLDLLRYIPYIDSPGNNLALSPFVMKETPVTDYRSEDLQKKIREDYIEGPVEAITGQDPPLPPSCAVIAICRSRNGYEVILDTADGYIYWREPTGRHDEPAPALNSTLERFRGDPANEWRLAGFNVYEPADFFALCKERYRNLSWIGLGPLNMSVMRRNMNWEYESDPDSDSDPEDDFSHNKIARKMKKAGWPGDGEGRGWDREKFERLLDQGNNGQK
ncbi:hypothetical protein GCG54_00010457 [Colletotrichum gloeosporioides]|uniref:Uncharacterized protein n=1 Tax=Colletotrichum gloeosporioides TaxID=474922 RepID=A0A8H4CJU1_COLGL|nr:uncharacterized protein GCG54_00010457 [Colletotrichum gloeosporioides]KAF3805181.1 hypothetical protein GCG54_00010457 [Colletotrichum gloeosporioides]